MNEKPDVVEVRRDDYEHLCEESHRYRMLRDLLEDHGCPFRSGCHIPTTVTEWLYSLRSLPDEAWLLLRLFSSWYPGRGQYGPWQPATDWCNRAREIIAKMEGREPPPENAAE